MRSNTTIKYEVLNRFTQDWVLCITMPYNPYKSIYGYYSRLWKRIKKVVCETENMPPQNIYLRKHLVKSHCPRTVWEWPCGVKLDMPNDATEYDYQIVIAQLKVIEMSRKK